MPKPASADRDRLVPPHCPRPQIPANTSGVAIPTGTPIHAGMYDAKNRLTGMPYDPAGNGSPITGRTYQYDVENRLVSVNGGTAALNESFAYDGEGRRVKRTVNGVTTTYVYDAFGQLAQEYGGTAGSPGRSYLFADHLGSTRMMTDGSGVVRGWWDYLPYGEEIAGDRGNRTAVAGFAYGGEEPSMMFTGQVRDRLADGSPSGLDYFGARYFSGAQGRFTSPDAPFADQHPEDPQSWNLYNYVRNNPLLYVDPSGHELELIGNEEERKKALEYLRNSVGNKVASRVVVKEVKDGDTTHYVVGIKGDIGSQGQSPPSRGTVSSVPDYFRDGTGPPPGPRAPGPPGTVTSAPDPQL